MRTLFGTLRPAGNTGDQSLATAVTAAQTNSTGQTAVFTVETANIALVSGGLGAMAIDQVVPSVAASLAFVGGGTIVASSANLFLRYSATEGAGRPLSLTGALEELGAYPLAMDATAWTGTKLDATTMRVEVDVSLPAGAVATLSVWELQAAAYGAGRLACGAAGDTYAEARA